MEDKLNEEGRDVPLSRSGRPRTPRATSEPEAPGGFTRTGQPRRERQADANVIGTAGRSPAADELGSDAVSTERQDDARPHAVARVTRRSLHRCPKAAAPELLAAL